MKGIHSWMVFVSFGMILCNLPTGAIGAANCGIDTYKTENLTIPQSWMFSHKAFCLENMNTTDNCTFVFAFCKPLPYTDGPCNGSAVCQVGPNGGSSMAKKYRIGTYNNTIDPFIHTIDGSDGFTAQYDHGQTIYDNSTNITKSVGVAILFRCDERVKWTASENDSQVPIPGQPLVVWNKDSFTYWIYVSFAGACIPINPIEPTLNPIEPTLKPITEALSAGTILIIVFACVLVTYCVGGCVVKSCQGNKGADVIPNNDFWTNLPGYVQDGCGCFTSALCCRTHQPGLTSGVASVEGYDSI